MTEDQNEKNNQQKAPKTPEALKQRVIGQIKQAQLKEVEGQIKTKIVELNKAEGVVAGIKQSIEDIIADNAEVFE